MRDLARCNRESQPLDGPDRREHARSQCKLIWLLRDEAAMQFREMTAWHAWIKVMLAMVIKVQIIKQENINFDLAM
ncbi:MAG TPA: hypothetical protein VH684_15565 [Xanthobacteraceae bacterium]|jgi:hypothetical protein